VLACPGFARLNGFKKVQTIRGSFTNYPGNSAEDPVCVPLIAILETNFHVKTTAGLVVKVPQLQSYLIT